MSNDIQKCLLQRAMIEWRKDAIDKIKSVGVKIGKAPKNKVILKLICEYGIKINKPPKINDFNINNKIEDIIYLESNNIGSCKTKLTNLKESKKIKSKRSNKKDYDGITVSYNKSKENKCIKPTGYKQKSKKSEIVNIDNFYDTWAWKDLRYQAIKKYGRRCMNCGQSPNKDNKIVLHVDHIKPIRKYPELALSIDNLQVLCGDCNQGKGYWDETDFRDNSKFSFIVSKEKLSFLHESAQRELN